MCLLGGLLIVEQVLVGRAPLATVDGAAERRLLEELAGQAEPLGSTQRLLRTREGKGWPTAWQQTSSPQRMLEVEASGRHVLFGRWHLEQRIGVLNSATSLVSQRVEAFWRTAQSRAAQLPAADRPRFWRRVLAPLAVDGVLQRQARGVPGRGPEGAPLVLAARRFERLPNGAGRVRWHSTWETVRPVATVSSEDWMRRLDRWERLGIEGVPVVETDDPAGRSASRRRGLSPDTPPRSEIRPLDTPGADWAVEAFEVRAGAAGLLAISRYQDGHWQARYRAPQGAWRPLPVHRVDYLAQGVLLPPGQWQVRFAYRPWWWRPTVVLALVAWSLVGLACLIPLAGRIVSLPRTRPSMPSGPRGA